MPKLYAPVYIYRMHAFIPVLYFSNRKNGKSKPLAVDRLYRPCSLYLRGADLSGI